MLCFFFYITCFFLIAILATLFFSASSLLHSRTCEYVWRKELFCFSLGVSCYCFYIYPSLLLWLSVRISFSCVWMFLVLFVLSMSVFLVCSCSLCQALASLSGTFDSFYSSFFIFCTNFFAKLFQYPLLVEDDLCVCVSVYCVLVWFGVTSLCESDKRRKRTSFFLF